ncbi:hypothetical protein IWX50DRAFT_658716 [Phyllosticta citricarpa]|uniref:4a-hydroxytetrahydrobiopterin dehydratase n=1 Tax=Phyllosticta citricarpa TaxID=55181 RepID=A0ABR1LSD3_9PEZI
MAFARRSPLLLSPRSTTALLHAPPWRLSSPLPFRFHRSRHGGYNDDPPQFSIFEEDVKDGENWADFLSEVEEHGKPHAGRKSQVRRQREMPGEEHEAQVGQRPPVRRIRKWQTSPKHEDADEVQGRLVRSMRNSPVGRIPNRQTSPEPEDEDEAQTGQKTPVRRNWKWPRDEHEAQTGRKPPARRTWQTSTMPEDGDEAQAGRKPPARRTWQTSTMPEDGDEAQAGRKPPARRTWQTSTMPEDGDEAQAARKPPARRTWQTSTMPEDGDEAQAGRKPEPVLDGDKISRIKSPLTIAEIKAAIAETEWVLSNDLKGIDRRYAFRDFQTAFKYMSMVEKRARVGYQHRPIMANWGNRLFVRWASANTTCVTRVDLQMSRYCDRLYNERFAESAQEEPGQPFDQIPKDLRWEQDRQAMYGFDYYYQSRDPVELWNWLPYMKQMVWRNQAFPLWAISHNRLVCTNVLWDRNTGTVKGLKNEDKNKWRPGGTIRRVLQPFHRLSHVADRASQNWDPDNSIDTLAHSWHAPRLSSTFLAEDEQESEPQRKRPVENSRAKKSRPYKPKGRSKTVRIFVD